jgi:hypothetical protein
LALHFVVRSCIRNVAVPILVKQKLHKSQCSGTSDQRKKLKMVGRKDNTTPTWINNLQKNKNKKACKVSNPKIPIGLYIRDEYDCKRLIVDLLIFRMEM